MSQHNGNPGKPRGERLGGLRFTGGRQSSFATSVFLIAPASSSVSPLTRSVMKEEDAMADPHPKVLNLTSEIRPFSSTRICSFITSPHAGAPTLSPKISVSVNKDNPPFGEGVEGLWEIQSSADVDVIFVERADVSRSFVVVDDFFMVETC